MRWCLSADKGTSPAHHAAVVGVAMAMAMAMATTNRAAAGSTPHYCRGNTNSSPPSAPARCCAEQRLMRECDGKAADSRLAVRRVSPRRVLDALRTMTERPAANNTQQPTKNSAPQVHEAFTLQETCPHPDSVIPILITAENEWFSRGLASRHTHNPARHLAGRVAGTCI